MEASWTRLSTYLLILLNWIPNGQKFTMFSISHFRIEISWYLWFPSYWLRRILSCCFHDVVHVGDKEGCIRGKLWLAVGHVSPATSEESQYLTDPTAPPPLGTVFTYTQGTYPVSETEMTKTMRMLDFSSGLQILFHRLVPLGMPQGLCRVRVERTRAKSQLLGL